ncbi:hypothetical protein CEP53_011903 [Fusarium sp. AF-6]|nr:hypothetical protein CEP53_011903 [Fusarium sp. AF-6]
MSDDRGAAPDPRDPESLVRIIDPTPFHTLCGRVDLLALSTTVNSLRALPLTAHPNNYIPDIHISSSPSGAISGPLHHTHLTADVVQDLGKDRQSQRVWAWAVGAGTLVVFPFSTIDRITEDDQPVLKIGSNSWTPRSRFAQGHQLVRDPDARPHCQVPSRYIHDCQNELLIGQISFWPALRKRQWTAVNKKIDAIRQHQQDGGDAPIVPVIATVLALGYDAMMYKTVPVKKATARKRKVNKKVDSEDDEDSNYVGPKKSDSCKRANIIPMDRRQCPAQRRCPSLTSRTTTFRKCVLYHS